MGCLTQVLLSLALGVIVVEGVVVTLKEGSESEFESACAAARRN